MPQSLREWNGVSGSVTMADGTVIPLRIDPEGSVVCNTCGEHTYFHLFRPGIDYRCGECVRNFGKAPTVTVDGVITLAPEGTPHVGTYK